MLRRLSGAVALALALAGCASSGGPGEGDPGGDRPASTSSSPAGPTSSSSSSSSSRTPTPTADAGLATDLRAVERAHPEDEVSVAYAPVGGRERATVVGERVDLVAWSTIKVPVSLAVLTAGTSSPEDMDAALTASDNDAAERLWESLGTGTEASHAVQRQLRRGGDSNTRVPGEVTSPGHSAPGQAVWRLSDQAAFTSRLPCLPGASEVTERMGRVIDSQHWGLGGIEGARFKGGWGETPEGYVVRQLGVLPGAKGRTAVALQVRTGTHEQGTRIADEVARVLSRHRGDLPSGSCG